MSTRACHGLVASEEITDDDLFEGLDDEDFTALFQVQEQLHHLSLSRSIPIRGIRGLERLPFDVLVLIFGFFTPHQILVCFLHVHTTWNNFFVNLPSLWTKILIRLDINKPESWSFWPNNTKCTFVEDYGKERFLCLYEPKMSYLTNTLLRRSQSLSLSVVVYSSESRPSAVMGVLSALQAHSQRIRHLFVTIPHSMSKNPFSFYFKCSPHPTLTSFHFDCHPYYDDVILDGILEQPLLETCHLPVVLFQRLVMTPPSTCHLRHLFLLYHIFKPIYVPSVISDSLETLYINQFAGFVGSIDFPRLSTLSIQWLDIAILETITCSQIETLILSNISNKSNSSKHYHLNTLFPCLKRFQFSTHFSDEFKISLEEPIKLTYEVLIGRYMMDHLPWGTITDLTLFLTICDVVYEEHQRLYRLLQDSFPSIEMLTLQCPEYDDTMVDFFYELFCHLVFGHHKLFPRLTTLIIAEPFLVSMYPHKLWQICSSRDGSLDCVKLTNVMDADGKMLAISTPPNDV